mmetsp:Transcript_17798/g.50436  ORF Transcript_17798/g.50436 Transcript_17798/m.50436 type:complete len:291 (-) Transcript_17798:2172-3044(-)
MIVMRVVPWYATRACTTLACPWLTQYGYDLSRKRPKESDAPIKQMESRLRKALQDHDKYIETLTVPEAETRNVFLAQCTARAVVASKSDVNMSSTPASLIGDRIKLVSIDIPRASVSSIIQSNIANADLQAFLDTVFVTKPSAKHAEQAIKRNSNFVPRTHVTMAHCSRNSAAQMEATFSDVIGSEVDVLATALLWNSEVAALEVVIGDTTVCGKSVPECQNEFAHVTVWTKKGVSAFEANKLARLAAQGKAERVAFRDSLKLVGRFSFWGSNNKPLVDMVRPRVPRLCS